MQASRLKVRNQAITLKTPAKGLSDGRFHAKQLVSMLGV